LYTLAIAASEGGRQKQGEGEFKVSLGYNKRSCLKKKKRTRPEEEAVGRAPS